ncbi:MAG: hypothetical protein JXA93_10115 [Anaerolineae bacterium]|nr:hypothetical protein [Anaerolineae bacterium]
MPAEHLPWAPVENLTPATGVAHGVVLERDPSTGTVHAVWVDGSDGQEEVMTRTWDDETDEWGPAWNLSSFDWSDKGVTLFFDNEGRGHCLWTRRYALSQGAPMEGSDVVYRQWHDGKWQREKILLHLSSFLPGAYNLVLTEKSDRVALFVVWGGGYRYAELVGDNWSDLTEWNTELGVELVNVIVDDQGHLHAAARGPNSSSAGYDIFFLDAYYVFDDGNGWTVPRNVSSFDGVASDLDLTFDGEGRLHFVWADDDSPYSSESRRSAIWENIWDGQSWSGNVAITPDVPDLIFGDVELESDVRGDLHLAWSEGVVADRADTNTDISYRSGDGVAWQDPEEVFTSTLASRNVALLVRQHGIHLAWQEGNTADEERDILATHAPLAACCRVYLPVAGKRGP